MFLALPCAKGILAANLRVARPAVSRQIRDLEEELGLALLERTAKTVRLSEAGRVFLREARAVLAGEARQARTGLNRFLSGHGCDATLLPPTLPCAAPEGAECMMATPDQGRDGPFFLRPWRPILAPRAGRCDNPSSIVKGQ